MTAADSELVHALALHLVPGVGPRTMEQLLEIWGTPEAVLRATRDELVAINGIGPKLARAIFGARELTDARDELTNCRNAGYHVFHRRSAEYPALLKEIPDAPSVLYSHGELVPQDEVAVAIVGSRRCTYYGISQAERIASGLARAGITIVSGLAKGIDAAAHRGALAAGGRTIAVTATGLETVYPAENEPLAKDIVESGAILTEFRLSQKPLAGLFPQRNRIISGLSLGVVVIEATRKSGALHTVRHASEQNRDVFAVPGRIDSVASEGCHDVIRDGGILIRGVDDVLKHLGPLLRPVSMTLDSSARSRGDDGVASASVIDKNVSRPVAPQREIRSVAELTLAPQEQQILSLVPIEPLGIDALLSQTEIAASRVLATLTILEMKRLIRRLPGNVVVRL